MGCLDDDEWFVNVFFIVINWVVFFFVYRVNFVDVDFINFIFFVFIICF